MKGDVITPPAPSSVRVDGGTLGSVAVRGSGGVSPATLGGAPPGSSPARVAARVAPSHRSSAASGASPDITAEVRRLVAVLRESAREAAGSSPTERRALLSALDGAIGALTVVRGEVLVAERDSGTWRASGDPTFEAWRGRTSRAGTRAVLTQVRQADTAAHLPALGRAVGDGEVTVDHMEALSRVVAAVPAPVRQALSREDHQAELLSVARRVDAGTFGRAAARLAARLDPRGHERDHQAQRAARYLHLADAPDGTRISGLLDRMTGHRLRLALESVSPRPAQDDERTSEQRRADALEVLAEKVLAAPGTMSGAAVRPHVSFLMDAATWAGLRAMRGAPAPPTGQGTDEATGGSPGESCDALGTASFEPVTLEDGTPVPLSEVARALCDCELTRIVVDADGAPLDIGRTQRTYTGVQRRAVIARDRGCAWPGCGAEARWSEVHHIRWWDRDDGPTSVANGALLCSFHHHEVHRRDLDVTRHHGPPGPDGRPRYSFHDRRGRPVATPREFSDVANRTGAAGPDVVPDLTEVAEPTGVADRTGVGSVANTHGTRGDPPVGPQDDRAPGDQLLLEV